MEMVLAGLFKTSEAKHLSAKPLLQPKTSAAFVWL